MIKHIVMWRVSGATAAEKRTNAETIKTHLETLPAQIDVIRSFQVGHNINPSERAGDLVLVSGFDSMDDLARYASHPAHQTVVKFIRSISTEVRVVDYEY